MKTLILYLLILFSFNAFSQKLYSTKYFKFNNQEVAGLDSADFIQYIYAPMPNSDLVKVEEKYKNGNLKMASNVPSNRLPFLGYVGEIKEYFENGHLKALYHFDRGMLSGEFRNYYKSNQLKEQGFNTKKNGIIRHSIKQFYDINGIALLDDFGNGHVMYEDEENIKSGAFKKGLKNGLWKTLDTDQHLLFEDYYVDGEFTKGISYNGSDKTMVYKSLNTYAYADNYGYNKNRLNGYYGTTRNSDYDGTISYLFDIDKEGKLSNVRLKCSLNEKKDHQLLETILKAKWHPAIFRGKPIDVFNYEFVLSYNLD